MMPPCMNSGTSFGKSRPRLRRPGHGCVAIARRSLTITALPEFVVTFPAERSDRAPYRTLTLPGFFLRPPQFQGVNRALGHVARHRTFGDIKSEFLKFRMDTWSAPTWNSQKLSDESTPGSQVQYQASRSCAISIARMP